jgi:putative MATE family efflux protein
MSSPPRGDTSRPLPVALAFLRKWQQYDLTRGPILKALVILAAPLLISNVGLVLFQIVDLAFISSLGDAPMASVIIVNQTIWQVVMMTLLGASFATQSLISQAIGAGDIERAERTAGQTVLIGAALSLIISFAGLFFTEFLFSLTGAQPGFEPFGVPYLRLLLLLNVGLVGAMLLRGVLVGSGDATTPLIISILQTPLALFGEWTLIFGNLGFPRLGVRGVAIGLAMGQMLALAIYGTVLARGRSRLHLHLRHLRPDPVILRRILRNTWPPAVQMMSMVITTFAILRLTNEFGASVQTAYSIGLRLGMIVPLISFPLVNACATLLGMAVGAGDERRAWKVFRTGLFVHIGMMWSALILLAFFRIEILAALTDEIEVIRVGGTYILFLSASFALTAVYFVVMRCLQGAGDFFAPMAISIATTFVLTLPLAFLVARWTSFGPNGIWTVLLLHSVVSTLATSGWLMTRGWARRGRSAGDAGPGSSGG